MAALQIFKSKINNACALIKSYESEVNGIDAPFTFPVDKTECDNYIKRRMGEITHLLNSLQNAVKLQDTQVNAAIEYVGSRNEEKEREKLMTELSKHLELESLHLEVMVIQWQNKIQFRQHELKEQSALLHCSTPSIPSQPSSDHGQAWIRNERQLKIRKPLLEIPTFSGNFREFNSFWTVFESLIHNDEELCDTDKFLFLKQALKGKAAAALSCIPVVGERYQTAIDILKKHFDRSANMADILINEIEKLPRASDNPISCRETFEAVNARIIHLEQTGMKMNADRVWRRIIFSKFPESICTTAIQEEALQDDSFNVAEILNTIDNIISLRETILLTTETLFPTNYHSNDQENEGTTRREEEHFSKPKRLCLCGQPHSPYTCQRYTTPEARRLQATNRGVCWRCFERNHNSNACTNIKACPKCKGSHHGSFCLSETRQRRKFSTEPRDFAVNNHQYSPASWSPCDTDQGRHEMSNTYVVQGSQQEAHVLPPAQDQCILQIASALIFNEAEWEYQPVTMLLDSGAQRSFIRSGLCEELNLPIVRTTSFITSGMGEQQEQFDSSEVHITLKSLHSSEKLKKLSLHTKQKLTTALQTATLTEAEERFISHEKLTIAQDTLSCKIISPDLIIGQDLLNLVTLNNDKVRMLPSGLILTPTIFGYVISGTSSTTTTSKFVGTFGCISMLYGTSPPTKVQQFSPFKRGQSGKMRQKPQTPRASIYEARADRQRWLNTVRSITNSSDFRPGSAMMPDGMTTTIPVLKKQADTEMTKTSWRNHRRGSHLVKTPPTDDMVVSNASTVHTKPTRNKRRRRRRRATRNRKSTPATISSDHTMCI